jgi:hypothetical protein
MWESVINSSFDCVLQTGVDAYRYIRQTALSLKQTASFDDLEERVTLYNWKTIKNPGTALKNQTGEAAVLDTLFLIQLFRILSVPF